MTTFKKDVLIGLMFVAGLTCFISGLFILSTLLFATATIYSNMGAKASSNNEILHAS